MSDTSGFTPGSRPPSLPPAMPPPLPPGGGRNRPTPPPLTPSANKGSLVWLWVTLGIAGLVGVLALVAVIGFMARSGGIVGTIHSLFRDEVELSDRPLLEERSDHQAVFVEAPAQDGSAPDAPPEGVFELVKYSSPAGELHAYRSPDPGDGGRHPAIVWAKGGFGGVGSFLWDPASPDDDQSARAFREAGIIMLCPSWRGEHDNPGRFELFYGELDDLLAAIQYAKDLPYVDPDRVYLAGHSTGGTLALLAAVSGVDVRACFSMGGAPDMEAIMADGEGYGNTPYDPESTLDHQLRSAIRYTGFIKSPTFYFEGGESVDQNPAERMNECAKSLGVPFKAFELRGDHFDILSPVCDLLAAKIQADTGASCTIDFDQHELDEAWREVHDIPLAATLERWMDEGGDLAEMIGALGPEAAADDLEDVQVMRAMINRLLEESGDQRAHDLAMVISGIRQSYDEEVLIYFDDRIAPMVRAWIRQQATNEERSEGMELAVLNVVESLVYNFDEKIGEIIVELVESGFAKEQSAWGGVFDLLEPEDGMFEEVLGALKDAPPAGVLGERWLNRANRLHFDDGWEGPHPYDSSDGKRVLAEMLAPSSDNAYTAGFGLAFVGAETRKGLVEQGLQHPSMEVRLEVAWSDARTGGALGPAFLKEACEDLEWSSLAVDYLDELELSQQVPSMARDGGFAAKAEMVSWLKHPNELGEMPESIVVHDERELFWPPSGERIPVRLFAFTYRFDEKEPLRTGYGMVGGTTWSSFIDYSEPPTAEELYVHHCRMELERQLDPDADELSEEEVKRRLREANPDTFSD